MQAKNNSTQASTITVAIVLAENDEVYYVRIRASDATLEELLRAAGIWSTHGSFLRSGSLTAVHSSTALRRYLESLTDSEPRLYAIPRIEPLRARRAGLVGGLSRRQSGLREATLWRAIVVSGLEGLLKGSTWLRRRLASLL